MLIINLILSTEYQSLIFCTWSNFKIKAPALPRTTSRPFLLLSLECLLHFLHTSLTMSSTIPKADLVNRCMYCTSSLRERTCSVQFVWCSHWQDWGCSGFPRMTHTKTGHGTLGCFGLKPIPNILNACCTILTALRGYTDLINSLFLYCRSVCINYVLSHHEWACCPLVTLQ